MSHFWCKIVDLFCLNGSEVQFTRSSVLWQKTCFSWSPRSYKTGREQKTTKRTKIVWKCFAWKISIWTIYSPFRLKMLNLWKSNFFDGDRKWLRSQDSLLFRGPLAPTKRVANRKRLKREKLCKSALQCFAWKGTIWTLYSPFRLKMLNLWKSNSFDGGSKMAQISRFFAFSWSPRSCEMGREQKTTKTGRIGTKCFAWKGLISTIHSQFRLKMFNLWKTNSFDGISKMLKTLTFLVFWFFFMVSLLL